MNLNDQYIALKQAENLLMGVQNNYHHEEDGCSECSYCELEEIIDLLDTVISDVEQGIINISGEKKLKELEKQCRQ